MNQWIDILSTLAGKPERTILGVMSGTSIDSLDLALCRIRGRSLETKAELLEFRSAVVNPELKESFLNLAFKLDSPASEILRLESELTNEWVSKIKDAVDDWNEKGMEIDLIASHGQTVLHLPDRDSGHHATWQIVDGDSLAHQLKTITVSDFRTSHIQAGFEGAPLAPLSELLLFSDSKTDRILLNLGGIANFTWLKAGSSKPAVPFATDTGPANTLLDAAAKHLMLDTPFDNKGAHARKGEINRGLLEELMKHPFLSEPFPKSTGQEEFNWQWVHRCLLNTEKELEIADTLATLTEFTARTVAVAIEKNVDSEEYEIYVSGGGLKNEFLIDRISKNLGGRTIHSSSKLGLDPDAKEAVLFAVLANERIAGRGWTGPDGTFFSPGKISLP